MLSPRMAVVVLGAIFKSNPLKIWDLIEKNELRTKTFVDLWKELRVNMALMKEISVSVVGVSRIETKEGLLTS